MLLKQILVKLSTLFLHVVACHAEVLLIVCNVNSLYFKQVPSKYSRLVGYVLVLVWGRIKVLRWFKKFGVFAVFKVVRYSFKGPIPLKFEHKLRRHKQSFGKIATTVVLDEDENLLWSGLQRHQSCHSNEMTLLPILLAAVYLGTGNCSSKIIYGSFFLQ